MAYSTALSIQRLRAEMLARWPDSGPYGTYRSPAAAADLGNPDSDHVPWLNNTVRALDIGTSRTVPAMGSTYSMNQLAEHLRALGASGDPRLNGGGYIIWNRRIAQSRAGWAWMAYNGASPHTDHIHVSVSEDPAGYNSGASWGIEDGDLDLEIPGDAGGSIIIVPEIQFLPAVSGFVEAGSWDNVAWQPGNGYRYRSRRIVVEASSWAGQRSVAPTVTASASEPATTDSGQPRRSELVVTEYETDIRSSGYKVNYAMEASHVYYDAHWNIGIWAAAGGSTRLPRPGFTVESSWLLVTQLQALDGSAAVVGQFFSPAPRFVVALLSDWSAYGDLRPDILDDETRSRTASLNVMSIEGYDFGIGGPLSVGLQDLVFSDFEGVGVPGTMDIQRPSSFQGGGCV